MKSKPTRVAIIGTGNIGSDLCARMLRDEDFEVVAFVGRRADSPGLLMFEGRVAHLISNGLAGLIAIEDKFEGFFDATSAYDHPKHWEELSKSGKWAIDLTPSQVGVPMVPELLGKHENFSLRSLESKNFSMVTCGGQSSAPLVYAISRHSTNILEVEVSSSIASKSAGPATRKNIDQYIQSTEELLQIISGCKKVKAILILNPSDPPVMMRTTVQVKAEKFHLEAILSELNMIVKRIKNYVPGYEVVVEPYLSDTEVLTASVRVVGAGYALPEYSGNLDIINAAAVETARIFSRESET